MNIFKQITANNIALEEYPYTKELAMEAYVIENESILRLDNDNFSDPSVIDAEIALCRGGRNNRDGRIDILAKYSSDVFSIVELKLDEINEESLLQLEGYLAKRDQLKDFIIEDSKEYDDPTLDMKSLKWIGVLMGRSISKGLSEKLLNGYEYNCNGVMLPIAGITVNRFRNKNTSEIYVVSDTYFRFSVSNRDYSKYLFRGQFYNKGQLVNEVLRYYVQNNEGVSFSILENLFPKSIQGGVQGVFTTIDIAKDVYERTGHKRHKIRPEELISLSDSIIATSTQWNTVNIKSFIDAANRLGLDIN